MENGFFNTLAFLLLVILKQQKYVFTQYDDGYQVACREQGHAQVTQTPYKFQARQGTKHHDHASREYSVNRQYQLVLRHKPYIGLPVIIVADNTRKGKQQNGHRNEDRTRRITKAVHEHTSRVSVNTPNA